MPIPDLNHLVNNLSWREPLWLLLGFVPLFLGGLRFALHKQGAKYADAQLLPWVVAGRSSTLRQQLLSKNTAYILAWTLFAVTAAGPRLPQSLDAQQPLTDMDIMLVVDVSRSMHVDDISPNRLRRAQIEIEELLTQATGNRIGIIVFAARPHLLVPLTSDYHALRFYLQALDSLILPTRGSDAQAALTMAQHELAHSTKPSASILLSDGDFSLATTPDGLADSQFDTPLFVLGIGSLDGEAIPLATGGWLQHNGQPVISRRNENAIHTLLQQTGNSASHYSPATDDDSDWQRLYHKGIRKLATPSATPPAYASWQELFPYPLTVALLFLWIAVTPYRLTPMSFLTNALFTTRVRRLSKRTAALKTLAIFSGLVLISLQTGNHANAATIDTVTASERQAFNRYMASDFSAALKHYKQLSGYTARLGEGASLYRLGDYPAAAHQFTRALLTATSDAQRATALFNLGNSYFQLGDYSAAVTAFTDTLRYQPNHTNSAHNLAFSAALKKAVDARIQQEAARTGRAGSGPRLAPAEDATNVNASGALAIDETEQPDLAALPLAELDSLANNTWARLIANGMNHIRLAAKSTAANKQRDHTQRPLAFIHAQLRMQELEDQQHILWQRLFEKEEGFPADLTEPRQVPGVRPW